MDKTRDPFFSRSALARDQHGGVGPRDGFGQIHQFAHLGTAGHDFGRVFFHF